MNNFQCGCHQSELPREPRQAKSRFIQDVSASIAVRAPKGDGEMDQQRNIQAHYSYLVELRRPLNQENYVEAQFPDTVDVKGAGYRVPMLPIKDQPGSSSPSDTKAAGRRYYALSPAVDGLKCGLLDIQVNIYEDQRRLKLIGTHRSQVLSRVNTDNCTVSEFISRMKNLNQDWKPTDSGGQE